MRWKGFSSAFMCLTLLSSLSGRMGENTKRFLWPVWMYPLGSGVTIPSSFEWEYKLRPSLCMHAVYYMEYEDPHAYVLNWSMAATETHSVCSYRKIECDHRLQRSMSHLQKGHLCSELQSSYWWGKKKKKSVFKQRKDRLWLQACSEIYKTRLIFIVCLFGCLYFLKNIHRAPAGFSTWRKCMAARDVQAEEGTMTGMQGLYWI